MRIALPSDGELYDSTIAFMRACGLTVSRPNSRRYTGTVPAIPGVEVLFQRTADVTQKVEEGSAEGEVLSADASLRDALSACLWTGRAAVPVAKDGVPMGRVTLDAIRARAGQHA